MSSSAEPLDLADAEERRRSQYISRRDLLLVGGFLLILLPFLWLVFQNLKHKSEEAVCTKNMKEIFTALSFYLSDNDNRFPPAYATDGGGMPLMERGGANTWISLIAPGMSRRASFQCPAAAEQELTYSVGGTEVSEAGTKNRLIASSYGFYRLWDLQPVSYMADPSGEVIASETSNMGSEQTFDPHPFKADGKPLPYDGFVIGWDTGNETLDPNTRAVTRLAFPRSSGGSFRSDGVSRHTSGIKALMGDGHVTILKPNSALIQHRGADPIGLWGDR